MSIHFKSDLHDWATPDSVFDPLNAEFNLNIDVCASKWNAKLPEFWTINDDSLAQDWTGRRCWMNPPYGRLIGPFIEKAVNGGADVVVALLPARTDTRWFHDYIYGKAEIRFIKGRIKFERPDGPKDPAPFPSMIVIWRRE